MKHRMQTKYNPKAILTDPGYTPERLINELVTALEQKNALALSVLMDVDHATIYNIRSKEVPINDRFIIRVMDVTGWSLNKVRELAGIPKPDLPKVM